MSADEKPGAQTVSSIGSNETPVPAPAPAPTPTTGGQRVKTLLKRFWWLLLALVLAIVLIVVLCVIFVGVPNIAQKEMNKALLTLNSQVITNPTPNSVHVVMNTTTDSESSYHPQLYSFNASLFLEDTEPDIKPFAYITIPAVKAADTFVTIIDQDMEVADEDQFAAYNKLVLTSESYRVALRGRIPLKEGNLPKTTVNFNHVVTSKGLNNLNGFEVRNISISLVADADGSNMKAQAFIPNSSPLTLDLGNVVMNVYVGNTFIAVATIPNLTLVPGDNLVSMSANANQIVVLGLISTNYPTAQLPVRIVGVNSTVDQQLIPYYSSALQAMELNTTLDLGPALVAANISLS